jgi:hypothetical protein
MPQNNQQLISTVVVLAFAALVLTLRMRRMRRVRPLKIEQLWMFPVFYGVIVVLLFAAHPPHGLIWLYALAGLAVGSAIGWYRGKLMHITVDAETHALSQQGSVAGMIFIFVLIALRYAARYYASSNVGTNPEAMLSITDVMLASGLGFIAAQRVEMGMRAKALLARARSQ